jgi:hypothetical protein
MVQVALTGTPGPLGFAYTEGSLVGPHCWRAGCRSVEICQAHPRFHAAAVP